MNHDRSLPQLDTGAGPASSILRPQVVTRAATLPLDYHSNPSSPRASRLHLAPEDAFTATSPPRRLYSNDSAAASGLATDSGAESNRPRRSRPKLDNRSRSSRRSKKRWKKLLWVKQSYPDNYTDQATFLENLQRNPRFQPYEFWPLVADSTVILQQVCSVIIFVVCFVGIFQERVSPVAVVGWGSFATFLGWLVWDWWVGQEDEDEVARRENKNRRQAAREHRRGRNSGLSGSQSAAASTTNLVTMDRTQSSGNLGNLAAMRQAHSTSVVSLHSTATPSSTAGNGAGSNKPPSESSDHLPPLPPAQRVNRASLRMSTIKSAILIYFTLLGLSPILKSLTRSTSSDSIWAMSFWLLTINIFFYDYSGGVGVKFPASLSTNAALMASTVLASRLPSTGQVFSLTLFSIEVFGLFPVFRRYARHRSWRYHVALSLFLIIGAGGGLGMILADNKDAGVWPWRAGLMGVVVAMLLSIVAMGGCSWWLISLQKYKEAINGPWDQARPILISRRLWNDD
ncbi:phosphatidylinositol N-acetylglucosaminyltransferase-domain-containing protein [Microdochium trichocladiopsis]|uniref:Phosphatidylinositol N-acetylglucosaminyltransferase-domain-containing protein n=1 Tax=Microdochium trichocladiopsis TaxID=1682393 RepID=A0A9P8YEJ3_9PEZI|nr:phosphatidylinositol N-acetylglucosaminyltransferase-domain-containing protein [Microdochium trichocladiopsis]KAH7037551.1 phosphatidylinositol N-acetylglucosaminyltransferase-domain-containing protein [Microdochium trichocladiopsis]